MVFRLRSIIRSNYTNKIASIVFGYLLWLSLAEYTFSTRRFTIPLCFYNTHGTLIKQSPEDITIELRAQRDILMKLRQDIAAHVDASKLIEGPQVIELTERNLLLPSTIRLHRIIPANIRVITERQ